jgi:hypothetical protein
LYGHIVVDGDVHVHYRLSQGKFDELSLLCLLLTDPEVVLEAVRKYIEVFSLEGHVDHLEAQFLHFWARIVATEFLEKDDSLLIGGLVKFHFNAFRGFLV